MRISRAVALAAACLTIFAVLAAPAQAQEPPAGGVDPLSAVLRPGDALRITVWRNEALSGEFAITADGALSHPLYRRVSVAGLTGRQAAEQVGQMLSSLEQSPEFVVEPLLQVSVGGEVRQPSVYRLPPETTIAQAVALAGGSTERGRLDRVILHRGGEELRIDLTEPSDNIAQTPIRSGDQLYVQRRVSIWREYIAPASSVISVAVSIISLLTR